MLKIVVVLVCMAVVDKVFATNKQQWTWNCESNKCVKKALEKEGDPTPVDVCKLLCSQDVLWPQPTGTVDLAHTGVYIDAESVSVESEAIHSSDQKLMKRTGELVTEAGELFKEQLKNLVRGKEIQTEHEVPKKEVEIKIRLRQPSISTFSLDNDESYTLTVSQTPEEKVDVIIEAETFFGGRNGLETLNQLCVYDTSKGAIVLPTKVNITDAPLYPYRGILLDTARNYISVNTIKKTLDAMASTKLNTFHWHITDSQSFPLVSESFPQLTEYGAYSPSQVYTKDEIANIVEYGRVRGIRILPEFDAPAHVGEGWQWAGDATVCYNAQPWTSYCVEPPCGQLNPTSEHMYEILEGIYRDMDQVFESDIFHMGGDEVNLNCWNSSEIITKNMAKLNISLDEEGFHELWSMFQTRALNLLEKVSGEKRPVILWTSSLTEKGKVDKYLDSSKYIIQIWTKGDDPLIAELLNKGYNVIFSNYDALYFDCGFGAWIGSGNNWCSPYIPWQKVYDNDPIQLAKNVGVDGATAKKHILGGEAALWTEQSDDSTVDARLWPRGAAMAERLWGSEGQWSSAQHRFFFHRDRLVQRNILPNTIQPEWCSQNPGFCYA